MNGNMSWMYQTEINFLTRKIACKLWKILIYFSEGDRVEIYRLAKFLTPRQTEFVEFLSMLCKYL